MPQLFEASLDAALDARRMTDLPKAEFGKRIVARFADEDGRVSPLPMLFRAAADAEARAVAQRLLRDRVFEPLERWIGGGDAAVRAARSEQGRVGNEGVSKCRSRWSRYN